MEASNKLEINVLFVLRAYTFGEVWKDIYTNILKNDYRSKKQKSIDNLLNKLWFIHKLDCYKPFRRTLTFTDMERFSFHICPSKKQVAKHHRITACIQNIWREEPGRLQSMESQRVGHDWATLLTHSQNIYKILISFSMSLCK